MDLMTALSTATEALKGIKQIRDFDRALSEAELKSKMADLYVQVSDLKMALADQREEQSLKDEKITELEKRIAELNSGEGCSICGEGHLKVVDVKPHPQLGLVGVQLRTLRCKCGHSEVRNHDPNNRTSR